jgi:thymidylate kinase
MIIVFSGTDGAGKSTQIDTLSQALETSGHRTRYLWARGGYTPLMLKAKTLLLTLLGRRGDNKGFDKDVSAKYVKRRAGMMRRPLVARIWLASAIIDLIVLYGIYVRLLSLTGTAVICDRYVGDTRIDFERNFPDQFNPGGPLWQLLGLVAPKPAIHFVLTVPVAVSQERSQLKNEPFPDDEETLAFRYGKYRALAELTGAGLIHLDGTAPLSEVSEQILAAVRGLPRIGDLG